MIVHATRKLVQRLPDVSAEALPVEGSLGHWHADRLVLDRRQCVLFCHDQSRAALFAAGLKKPQSAALSDLFRPLFADTLVALGCPESQARRTLMALRPCPFDTATDRSVLSSMRVIRLNLEAWLSRFPNVVAADPVETSCRLTRRPPSIHGGNSCCPMTCCWSSWPACRQTGKSTLERSASPDLGATRRSDVLDAARRDPEALVGGTKPLTLVRYWKS